MKKKWIFVLLTMVAMIAFALALPFMTMANTVTRASPVKVIIIFDVSAYPGAMDVGPVAITTSTVDPISGEMNLASSMDDRIAAVMAAVNPFHVRDAMTIGSPYYLTDAVHRTFSTEAGFPIATATLINGTFAISENPTKTTSIETEYLYVYAFTVHRTETNVVNESRSYYLIVVPTTAGPSAMGAVNHKDLVAIKAVMENILIGSPTILLLASKRAGPGYNC